MPQRSNKSQHCTRVANSRISARIWKSTSRSEDNDDAESSSRKSFWERRYFAEVFLSSTQQAPLPRYHPFPAHHVLFFQLITFGIRRLTTCRLIGSLLHGRRVFQENILLLALVRRVEKTMVSLSQLLTAVPLWYPLPLVILLNLILALTHLAQKHLLNPLTVAMLMRL